MGLAPARENGGLAVFTLHAFNELLSSDSPTVTYKAHIPTLMMHVCATHRLLELSPGPSYLHQTWFHFIPNSPIWVKVKQQVFKDRPGLDLRRPSQVP